MGIVSIEEQKWKVRKNKERSKYRVHELVSIEVQMEVESKKE